jgi:hypothetical protein
MKAHHAWMLVLAVAACGDDGGSSIDAADHDAEIADASIDADLTGPATITVMSEGNPLGGIDVVFSNPDGSVLSEQTTDASGEATEDVLAGSAATIAVMIPGGGGGGDGYFGITWLGIEPGDDLVWAFDPPQPTVVGDLSVTLPGVHAGATDYEVMLGCTTIVTGTPVVPVTGQVTSDCLGSDGNIDVVAIALDVDGVPLAYSHDADVPAVSGGTTSVTLGAWQTTFDPLTVTLTNAPAAIAGAGFDTNFRIDGLDFIGASGGGAFTAGTATLQSGYWQGGIIEQAQYSIFMQLGATPADGTGILLVGHSGTPATATHDLSTLLLPAIGSATAANAQGEVELGWTSSGTFGSADGQLWLATWQDGTDVHQRFVLAPPAAANPFHLPAMPDSLMGFRPTNTAVFDIPTMIVLEGDFVADYAAFRPIGFDLFGGGPSGILPAGGGVMRASLGGQAPGGP